MADNRLRLIVNFAGVDKLSGSIRNITASGKQGAQILGRMKAEARDLDRQLNAVRGDITRGIGGGAKLGGLVEEERRLAEAARAANARLAEQQRNLERITRLRDGFGKAADITGRLGRGATVGATLPLGALAASSAQLAIDQQELASAFAVTFGKHTAAMEQWAARTGAAMGRSRTELMKASNTFGIFFNQATRDSAQAADMSRRFAVLAQDLSSFFNVSEDVALQKLRSGLSGESEPLRDFGVFLTEATVQAEALRMGLAKTSKGLTEQDKIMARYSLILKATGKAQGDVVRTGDSTANRIRAAQAAWNDLQLTIGEKLIPAITPAINLLIGALNAFNRLSPATQKWLIIIGAAVAALGPLLLGLSGLFIGLKAISGGLALLSAGWAAIGGLSGAVTAAFAGIRIAALFMARGVMQAGLMMLANPMVLAITVLVGAVALAGYLIWKHWDKIKAAFNGGVAYLGGLASRFLAFGRAIMDGLVNGISQRIAAIKSLVTGIAGKVAGWFRGVLGIKSPSRVFMAMGGHIAGGLALGIAGGQGAAFAAVDRMASGVAERGFAMPSIAPIGAGGGGRGTGAGGGGQAVSIGDVTIHLHQQPGQSARDMASEIEAVFKRLMSGQSAQQRSAFADY